MVAAKNYSELKSVHSKLMRRRGTGRAGGAPTQAPTSRGDDDEVQAADEDEVSEEDADDADDDSGDDDLFLRAGLKLSLKSRVGPSHSEIVTGYCCEYF